MQIAFDSSTLILLAKTGLLDIFLEDFSGSTFVSQAVERECMAKQSPDAHLIQKRIEEGRIGVKQVRDRKLGARMEKDFNINLGEAETIIMGKQFKAIVATDDWNAIQACKILKLSFTSALAILIRLKEKKIINREFACTRLQALAGYGRYDEQIIRIVRNRLEE